MHVGEDIDQVLRREGVLHREPRSVHLEDPLRLDAEPRPILGYHVGGPPPYARREAVLLLRQREEDALRIEVVALVVGDPLDLLQRVGFMHEEGVAYRVPFVPFGGGGERIDRDACVDQHGADGVCQKEGWLWHLRLDVLLGSDREVASYRGRPGEVHFRHSPRFILPDLCHLHLGLEKLRMGRATRVGDPAGVGREDDAQQVVVDVQSRGGRRVGGTDVLHQPVERCAVLPEDGRVAHHVSRDSLDALLLQGEQRLGVEVGGVRRIGGAQGRVASSTDVEVAVKRRIDDRAAVFEVGLETESVGEHLHGGGRRDDLGDGGRVPVRHFLVARHDTSVGDVLHEEAHTGLQEVVGVDELLDGFVVLRHAGRAS